MSLDFALIALRQPDLASPSLRAFTPLSGPRPDGRGRGARHGWAVAGPQQAKSWAIARQLRLPQGDGREIEAQLYPIDRGGASLGLRAGTHTLVAKAAGKEQRWEVVLVPGQAQEHAFVFAEKKAEVAPPPPSASRRRMPEPASVS